MRAKDSARVRGKVENGRKIVSLRVQKGAECANFAVQEAEIAFSARLRGRRLGNGSRPCHCSSTKDVVSWKLGSTCVRSYNIAGCARCNLQVKADNPQGCGSAKRPQDGDMAWHTAWQKSPTLSASNHSSKMNG